MRRVNLLPPEERRRGGRRPSISGPTTRRGVYGILLILGALFILIMVGLYLFYSIRLGNEQEEIANLDAQIAEQQARIQELSPYADLQARLDAKKPIADGIFRTRFSWDEFLQGLGFVIPETTALDVFTANAAPVNAAQGPGGTTEEDVQNLEPPGAITFSGFAQAEYQNISDFIVRMNNLRFLANADLTDAVLNQQDFDPEAITFNVNAQLITRIGENGNEVRIGEEREGGGNGGGNGGDPPPIVEDGPQANNGQYAREGQASLQYGGANQLGVEN